jgi:hypothetical protein
VRAGTAACCSSSSEEESSDLTLQAVLDLLVVGTFSLLSSFDLSQHVVQIVDGFLLILLACLHDDVRHK